MPKAKEKKKKKEWVMRPTPLEQGWVDAGDPLMDKNIDVVKDLNVWKKKVAKERNTTRLQEDKHN